MFCPGIAASAVIFFYLIILSSAMAWAVAAKDKVEIAFDGRMWQEGYSSEDERQSIIKYVLSGETVNGWSELVTAQIFYRPKEGTTPETFEESMKANLLRLYPEAEWGTLRKTDNDLVYERKVQFMPGFIEQELARIIVRDGKVYVIHYATHRTPIDPAVRDSWVKILDGATVKE
jgi:hypothetical protein